MAGDATIAVSVCVITYNHAPFIRDCLEGVLAQRASFALEVVVGEDASLDETLSICRQVAREDTRVRVLAAPANRGMMSNFLGALAECRGRYVALCEGDDYWIDDRKLDLQYDFLERHPSCSVCFHNAFIEYANGRRDLWKTSAPNALSVPSLMSQWIMPTASVMFRNPGQGAYPPYLERATHGDLGLFVFLADRGDIGYIDRVMSVYRRHPGSIMSSFEGVEFNERESRFLEEMNEWFGGRYQTAIYRRIARLKRSSARRLAAQGARTEAFAQVGQSLRFRAWADPLLVVDVAKVLFLTVAPAWLRSRFRRWGATLRRTGESRGVSGNA
jgi:glycosyltransferase involved in cell wall biosynthesis